MKFPPFRSIPPASRVITPKSPGTPLGDTPEWILVLGGGGMKGMAHLGAWKALEERGYRPDAIVGTSIGALLGAMIASGMSTDELMERAIAITRDDILKINRRIVWKGLTQVSVFVGEHFREFLRTTLPEHRFSDLKIPLRLNAVSLVSGRDVWFGTGRRTDLRLPDAVYASCALPMYFPPLKIKGEVLVDGGVQSNLGIEEAFRWGAKQVLAVDVRADLLPPTEGQFEKGMMEVHDRVLNIVGHNRRERDLERWKDEPVIYVRPEVGHFETFDFNLTEHLIELGYKATVEALRAHHL